MRLAAYAERARLLAALRAHFADTGAVEVVTPILSSAGNTDPNIESFETSYVGPASGGAGQRWLRTSPEFALKRLLAAGIGDCFEIGPVFRNGEYGRRHNPEFTMLEWYRVGIGLDQLMDEVEALVRRVAQAFGRTLGAVQRIHYRTLFVASGLDPWLASDQEVFARARACGIDPEGLSRDDALDVIRTHQIEPTFANDTARFVYHFPPAQAALARVERVGGVHVAQRFELFLGSLEIANGYDELRDCAEQRRRFEHDLSVRLTRARALPLLDERLLASLPMLPSCCGVAMGVDRLHQFLAGSEELAAVAPLRFDVA